MAFFIVTRSFLYLLPATIFSVAVFSDFLDGYVARSRGEETVLGALLDPVADKILVLLTLLSFCVIGTISFWMVVPIVIRDLFVTTKRFFCVNGGQIIQPTKTAKFKTVVQFVAIYFLFVCQAVRDNLGRIADWLNFENVPKRMSFLVLSDKILSLTIFFVMVIVLFFTLLTGMSYLKKAKI